MKFFFTITKKRLLTALCILIVAIITAFWFLSVKADYIDGSTHQKRFEFIRSLNLVIDEKNITCKETFIPDTFGDVYNKYNQLQQKSGFNLKNYKGRKVTVYTYNIDNKNCELHLIVCDGKIIGGDIAEIEINGEMKPLKR